MSKRESDETQRASLAVTVRNVRAARHSVPSRRECSKVPPGMKACLIHRTGTSQAICTAPRAPTRGQSSRRRRGARRRRLHSDTSTSASCTRLTGQQA